MIKANQGKPWDAKLKGLHSFIRYASQLPKIVIIRYYSSGIVFFYAKKLYFIRRVDSHIMLNQVKKFFKEEEGQGMTEYGLILGLIAVGTVAAFTAFGEAIVTKLQSVKTQIFG